MKAFRAEGGLLLLATLSVAWFSGCRADVLAVPPRPSPRPSPPAHAGAREADSGLIRTGYAVQVGAFSVLANAQALTRNLNTGGLDAYYFPHESGLYKVRFGDFPTREAATLEAGRLRETGLIGEYYIVAPEDYAVSKTGSSEEGLREHLVITAERFIGVEYAWGGTSSRQGFDCSGLVRAVYDLNGLSLPRSSADQYRAGTPVARNRLKGGDLVFFSASPGGRVSHVGIFIGGDTFIHAPGTGSTIRRDSLVGFYFRDHFSGARTYLN